MMVRWARACLLAVGVTPARAVAQQAVGRPIVPADLLAIRGYGARRVSPDGQLIAFEVNRSRNQDGGNNTSLDYVSRSDLWIVRRDGSGRRLVLKERGATVNTWQPQWSPTGRYLAFFVSVGHRNAYLDVWDRTSGHVRRIANDPVDLAAQVSRGTTNDAGPICWLDTATLAIVALPETGQALVFHEDTQSLSVRERGLAAANRGRTVTAVIASSPPDSATQSGEEFAHLLVANMRTGTMRRLGHIPVARTRLARRVVVLSRDLRLAVIVAHLQPIVADPQIGWSVATAEPARVGVLPLAGEVRDVRWLSDVVPYTGRFGGTWGLQLAWAPTDSTFCLVTWRIGQTPPSLTATVVDGRTLTGREVATTSTNLFSPPSEGGCADGDPDHHEPIPVQISRDGRLYMIDSTQRERTLFPALNPQLNAIQGPRYIAFKYQGKYGDTLNATALMPYGYEPGHRYPTVVTVYGGDLPGPVDQFAALDNDSFLNMLLWSAHGYMVLKPSLPLTSGGSADDPMTHLDDGVDSAVDRLVMMGLADSTKLALIGHSYGGYTVYGLLTQTRRYKAAIALAGLSDLVSNFGEFDPRHRYTAPNAAAIMGPFSSEHLQEHMGVPPWIDPQRYIRNSPIFFVDRVDTPLLIITGDLDIRSTQDEELYTALYRLGRRAEFVRYLGEGHSIESPANLIDLWTRMFGWFDRYLMPAKH
jgi:dipeptidyl aminopeptidase/acylaminoacyl peptidase